MTQQQHQQNTRRKGHKGNHLLFLLTGILLGASISCFRRKRQHYHRDDRMWFI